MFQALIIFAVGLKEKKGLCFFNTFVSHNIKSTSLDKQQQNKLRKNWKLVGPAKRG